MPDLKIERTRMPEKSFGDWYGKHRDEYNEKRRERYKHDKDYRRRVTNYTKRYRADNPSRVRHSDGSVAVRVKGKLVRGFRTGAVATKLKVTAEAIRYLEKQGYIPSPSLAIESKIRTYHRRQVPLIRRAFVARRRFNAGRITQDERDFVTEDIRNRWDTWS